MQPIRTPRHARFDAESDPCNWSWDSYQELIICDELVKKDLTLNKDFRKNFEIRTMLLELHENHPTHSLSELKDFVMGPTLYHRDFVAILTRWNECLQRASICPRCPTFLPERTPSLKRVHGMGTVYTTFQ
jgi:hypothetical protein